VTPLRIVFMGSPEFAVPTLRVVANVEEVVAVVTQPDKPAGRGQKVVEPAVKRYATERGLPVLQPARARDPEFIATLAKLAPDVCVVVAYGKILPQAVLDVPRLGCLNVHGSLLPKYRGAAPVQWAVINGERETGVTIMKLDAGMDTGPMLLWRAVRIGDDETSGALAQRLAGIGAELMAVALGRLKAGALVEHKQDDAQATMAPLLKKELGNLDFTWPAERLRNLVRGVDPWPGAHTWLDGEVLKVWGARRVPGGGDTPGEVLGVEPEGLVVATGEGAIAFAELQLAGRKRLPASAFVAGRPIRPGTRLGVWPTHA
jgi:methionyl-tRNA formyltransferase